MQITKKALDETRAKLEKSSALATDLEKEVKVLREDFAKVSKEKKGLESACGDTEELKTKVGELSEKVSGLENFALSRILTFGSLFGPQLIFFRFDLVKDIVLFQVS